MKFQATGSSYNFGWAMRQLFAVGSNKKHKELASALSSRYDGEAYLYNKGRNALSEAVRIATVATGRNSVAINGLTCSVVVDAIIATGAEPVYVDVNPDTTDFSAETLARLCEKDETIGTVIIQNTFGIPCDIAGIEKVANKHRLVVIEDLAHAIGQQYPDGREIGTVGDITMLSFGRDKLLDVVNGGALIIRNDKLRRHVDEPTKRPRTIDQLRDRLYPILIWCARKTYSINVGKAIIVTIYKLKLVVRASDGAIDRDLMLPNWQASLALLRFNSLADAVNRRRDVMREYERQLGEQLISRGGTIRCAVISDNRPELLRQLKESGYEFNDTWYDVPIIPKRRFDHYRYPTELCPNATELATKIINLPTHHEISSSDIKRISEIVRQHD